VTNAIPARFSITRSGILNRLPEQGGAMPEHRGRKHHQDRVAETLRLEIGAMIEGELSDPRIDFCYVSEVALNPGAKSARVYIAVDSSVKDIAKAEAQTIAGLEAAKGYIRFELKERMGVRHVPELSFLADRSGRFQARIVELMDRSRKKAAHRAGTSGKSGEESKGPTQAEPPSEQGAIVS
jgi:ribosome-binding factor A